MMPDEKRGLPLFSDGAEEIKAVFHVLCAAPVNIAQGVFVMFRKITAIGLCLLALSLHTIDALADGSRMLTMGSYTDRSRGDVVTISCKVSGVSGDGVGGAELGLVTDDSLIITGVAKNYDEDGLSYNIEPGGHAASISFAAPKGVNYGNNTVLFNVSVRVSDDATDGTHPVQLTVRELKYYTGIYLDGVFEAGEYSVENGSIGVVVPRTPTPAPTPEPTPEPTPSPAPIMYAVKENDEALTWDKKKDASKGLTITSEADFAKFIEVSLDDVILVKESDYSVKEGSTVVTIKPSVLSGLSVGETHKVVIRSGDGSAVANVKITDTSVASATPASNTSSATTSGTNSVNSTSSGSSTRRSPQTGGNPMWMVVMIVAFVMAGVTLLLGVRKKMKN